MTRFWNKQGLPHKGWIHLGVTDMENAEYRCQMCDKEEIRFLHKMYHPELPDYYEVGCVCAGHMTDPYQALEQEKIIRKKSMSKKRFMKDNWNTLPIDNQNDYTYKSVRNKIYGVFAIKDKWHYNVETVISEQGYNNKEDAMENLYKILQKIKIIK